MNASEADTPSQDQVPPQPRVPQAFTWWPSLVGAALLAVFAFYAQDALRSPAPFKEPALWGIFGAFGAAGLLFLLLEIRRRRRHLTLAPAPRGMAIYRNGLLIHELHMGETRRLRYDYFYTAFFFVIGLSLLVGAGVMPFNKGAPGENLTLAGFFLLLGLASTQGAWARLVWIRLELPVEKGRTEGVWIRRSDYRKHWT
jgi:hypothetical protein